VYIRARPFAHAPEDLNKWFVRNAAGEMVPFSAFHRQVDLSSPRLERYNGLPSVEILGTRRRARARAPP
jgi:multidrug efflux pump subunit AcrB